MKTTLNCLFIIIVACFVNACTKDISTNTYDTQSIGHAARVEPGVIVAMRTVKIDKNTRIGGLAGAGTGAVLGSTIGGSREASAIAAIGGAVVGGLAGDAIEKRINQDKGVEFVIRLNNGSVTSVTQASDQGLSIGQRVLVIYGRKARVVPDNTQPNTWSAPQPAAIPAATPMPAPATPMPATTMPTTPAAPTLAPPPPQQIP